MALGPLAGALPAVMRMPLGPKRRARSSWLVVLAAATGTLTCGPEVPPTLPLPPADTLAPVVRIAFPAAEGAYDRDSNGLVDLEVAWSDSGAGVDPWSARVTCWSDCLPEGAFEADVSAGWRVVRRDARGLVLEETLPLLVRAGERTLVVSVADSAGNRSAPVRAGVQLPPGALHRVISLAGAPDCQPERGVELALTPDGGKGFAPYHGCVAVFDPDGVLPTHFVRGIPNLGWASFISVDTATGLAYLGGGGTLTTGFTVFDTQTETVRATKSLALGLASVAVHGTRILAGEACTNGRVFIYDKTTLAQVGRIEVNAEPEGGLCPGTLRFVFAADDRRVWASEIREGPMEFDLVSQSVQARLGLGRARGLALLDSRWLYAARFYEVAEWDISSGRVTAEGGLGSEVRELALSPNGRFLLTTGSPNSNDQVGTGKALLFAVPGLRLLYSFPHRPGRIYDAAVFHPDGKRVYVMAEYQLDVYLVRPL